MLPPPFYMRTDQNRCPDAREERPDRSAFSAAIRLKVFTDQSERCENEYLLVIKLHLKQQTSVTYFGIFRLSS